MQETWVRSLGQEDPLEKRMVTHSSILVWRIPWTEDPGGLQSVGLQSQTRLNGFHFIFKVCDPNAGHVADQEHINKIFMTLFP